MTIEWLNLPLALLSFNVGVEIGQVAFVLLILALERSFRQPEIRWSRWAEALPGYGSDLWARSGSFRE